MADIYSKFGIIEGPSMWSLILGLFGSEVSEGEVVFPELMFELSKNYLFGWMPKIIGIKVYSVERVFFGEWRINAKILDEGEQFDFRAQYSTKERVGAGKIVFSGIMETPDNPTNYCQSFIDHLSSEKQANVEAVYDVLAFALALWRDADLINSEKTLAMAIKLKNLSADKRVKYLMDLLIKKINSR